MYKDTCIILNPAAKGEHAKKLESKIRKLFPKATMKKTRHRGQAKTLAKEAVKQGFKKIVSAGGDGTLNEVANGIANKQVVLGVLPVGSVNVFAMEMGIPFDLEEAAYVIFKGEKKKVDLARINGDYFVQLAGVGLDADVVKRTSFESKKALGPLSYLLTLTQMMDYQSPKLIIEDDKLGKIKGAFTLIGNGRFYGGPFKIFPKGKINDGKLDVCVFKKMGYMDIFRYLHGIMSGTHTQMEDVVYFQSKRLSIFSEDPVPVEVDGEVYGYLPVEFSVEKHSLTVLV